MYKIENLEENYMHSPSISLQFMNKFNYIFSLLHSQKSVLPLSKPQFYLVNNNQEGKSHTKGIKESRKRRTVVTT